MTAAHAVPAYVPEAMGAITHDIEWEYDSFDANGPCVGTNSFQACGAEMATELEALAKADTFKRNVRVVARGGGK